MTDEAKKSATELGEEMRAELREENAFVREAEPLWRQLYAIAAKHDVSCMFSACIEMTEAGRTMAGFAHLVGPVKTPDEMVLASKFLFNTKSEAMDAVTAFVMRDTLLAALGVGRTEVTVAKLEEDLRKPQGTTEH